MDHDIGFEPEESRPIVYIRPVPVKDLPAQMQEYAGGLSKMYAVYDGDGVRLAVVRDRKLAFVLARQNDLSPVSVH